MMNSRVLHRLSQTNLVEEEQKNQHCFVEDMPVYAIKPENSSGKGTQILNNTFFKNRDIFVSRHNRYAEYPVHSHTFLEMNYLLRGTASEVVNGQNITLHQGDLLLLDVGSEHSIAPLHENDILINILFKEDAISIDLLNDLRRSNSVLFDFLINRSIGTSEKNGTFLIFKQKREHEIQDILNKIIEEYYLKRNFSNSIIKSYLQVLLVQLVRDYPLNSNRHPNEKQILITKILQQISTNYKNICLDALARKYKYNKNYLSNVFKEETGKTFTEAVTQQKLIQAHNLISSTNLSITEIMRQVGISNKTFFYRKYKEFYHGKPSEDR